MTKQTSKKASIEPLADRVVISEIDQTETQTASGIYLPDSASQKQGAKKGKVVSVGKGKYDNGELLPMSVKKGDVVLFSWGEQVEIDKKSYFIVKESEISAIIR